MARSPVNVLTKLLNGSRIEVGGGAAVAGLFLPGAKDQRSIRLVDRRGRDEPSPVRRTSTRRLAS
jgi:hypothetical protein